jgi:RHS repeat-associated protein
MQSASANIPGYNKNRPAIWLWWEDKEAVAECMRGYFFLDANPVYSFRDPSIRLYQATVSITFDVGFESALGDEFIAEIVSYTPPNAGVDNADMNWVLAKTFDENGNVIGESKQFFDNSGRSMQTQSKVTYRLANNTTVTQVFANQSVRDALGRDAITTMSAPINNSGFAYKPDFVTNSSGGTYDYRNFDRYNPSGSETDKTNNPDPIGGQNTQGTLGWYYGSNNNLEPYTATTNFPYSRQSFYRDGDGTVKKEAGSGEVFRMGTDREASSYTTPVYNELTNYLAVRNRFFTINQLGELPANLASQALQMVTKDPNGKEAIVIQDKAGHTIMAARPGTDMQVANSVALTAGGTAILYFKIFSDNSAVSISGDYTLYDMNAEAPASLVNGNQLNKGYFKVKANSGTVTVNYTNGYTDISYYFYNQVGQLIAGIAPEGVKKLIGNGLNNYLSINAVPFLSMNEYDTQGRLVKTTSADAGACELVYRKDGAIRFSQNAEQKPSGRYSYTNYDQQGRAIESGEYLPDVASGGIPFNSDLTAATNPMRNILEDVSATGGLTNGTKTDVIMTLYDIADINFSQAGYAQDATFLGGWISMTKKYSSIVNNTPNSVNLVSSNWYNYDEEGKVLWVVQYINGLGYKTTDFTYDIQGRMIKKDFQKGAPAERFIHYYEYDAVTQNLVKVQTSVDDITKILQATYIYYLHGPLKRIELAGDLQGIDYTYTLQGALKAINNSDKTKDPGGDGSNAFSTDAFGMVVDYFPGDYQNSRPVGSMQPINGVSTAGIGTDSYVGNIKAMTWFSKKPASVVAAVPGIEDPTTYIYQYDDKYQFTESTWGAISGFSGTSATFTATGFNKETVKDPITGAPAYDANGNILNLQRTGATGAITDKFTYNYNNNNNKLQSVVNEVNGVPQPYASYTYDQLGQLIGESNTSSGTDKSKYIEYDITGKVVAVYRYANKTGPVVQYVYDETGQRIIKRSYNASNQLSLITYYVGPVIYTQPVTNGTILGAITAQEYDIQGAGSRLGVFYRQVPVYAYELSDYLGNVRAVVAKSASTMEVRMYTDYYPYGMKIRGSGEYRYGYQGQYAEKDDETDWNAFELRMYDSRIARWLSSDPEGQYWSPYMSMGNDPANRVDVDGGFDWVNDGNGGYFFDENVHNQGDITRIYGSLSGYSYAGRTVADFDYLGMGMSFFGSASGDYRVYSSFGDIIMDMQNLAPVEVKAKFNKVVKPSASSGPSANAIQGNFSRIPHEIVLSNGNRVRVTFENTESDGLSSDNPVKANALRGLIFALEESSRSVDIHQIGISATTNGSHSKNSSHYVRNGARAIDINKINGDRLKTLPINADVVVAMQDAFARYHLKRENYGPSYNRKYSANGGIEVEFERSSPTGKAHRHHLHFAVFN